MNPDNLGDYVSSIAGPPSGGGGGVPCGCNKANDFCSFLGSASGTCKSGCDVNSTRGCGWLWAQKCDGKCFLF